MFDSDHGNVLPVHVQMYMYLYIYQYMYLHSFVADLFFRHNVTGQCCQVTSVEVEYEESFPGYVRIY